MHIECPSCSTENKIEFGENIICSECKKTFSGHTYKKFKKPLISATTALIIGAIGAIGAHRVDKHLLEEKRYPVNVEYELINSCINSSRNPIEKYRYIKKTQICTCALEATMSEVSFKEMNENETAFLSRFRSNINDCR